MDQTNIPSDPGLQIPNNDNESDNVNNNDVDDDNDNINDSGDHDNIYS